jgi:hypothetical protein
MSIFTEPDDDYINVFAGNGQSHIPDQGASACDESNPS